MSSEKSSMRGVVLRGALLLAADLAAAPMPSPALLVVIKGETALAIVDPVAGKVVGRAPTGEGPQEVTGLLGKKPYPAPLKADIALAIDDYIIQ